MGVVHESIPASAARLVWGDTVSTRMAAVSLTAAANAVNSGVDMMRVSAAVDARRLSPGAQVHLGIRPEHLVLGEVAGQPSCAAQVQHVERLGDASLLYARLAGVDDALWTVRVDGAAQLGAGRGARPSLPTTGGAGRCDGRPTARGMPVPGLRGAGRRRDAYPRCRPACRNRCRARRAIRPASSPAPWTDAVRRAAPSRCAAARSPCPCRAAGRSRPRARPARRCGPPGRRATRAPPASPGRARAGTRRR